MGFSRKRGVRGPSLCPGCIASSPHLLARSLFTRPRVSPRRREFFWVRRASVNLHPQNPMSYSRGALSVCESSGLSPRDAVLVCVRPRTRRVSSNAMRRCPGVPENAGVSPPPRTRSASVPAVPVCAAPLHGLPKSLSLRVHRAPLTMRPSPHPFEHTVCPLIREAHVSPSPWEYKVCPTPTRGAPVSSLRGSTVPM